MLDPAPPFRLSALTVERLRLELDHLGRHADARGHELAFAETALHREREAGAAASGYSRIRSKRILYVGGRPSSASTIRDFTVEHGGEFRRHDGGVEHRKGLLAAYVAWAQRWSSRSTASITTRRPT